MSSFSEQMCPIYERCSLTYETVHYQFFLNMSTSVEFITTTKGRPLIVLDGLLYIQDRQTDTKTYWRCENHKTFNCHFRIHTCNESVTKTHVKILKQHGNHAASCKKDLIKLSLRRFHEDIADRAKNTQETTDIVLTQCISKLPDSARIRLPPLDHVKRTILQHRKKINLPQVPNDVDFPTVPSVLQLTKRNDTFLRIDTGPGE